MKVNKLLAAGIAAFVVMLAVQPSHAFEPIDAPVTVLVKPAVALVKSKVTISGTSLVVGKNNQVSIKISPASGAPQELKATVDAMGAFSAEFTPATEGKYKIVVTAPDGKGTVTGELTVASPTGSAAMASITANALIKTMQSGHAAGDAQIANLPPSPVKDEFQKKSAELKKKIAEIPAAQKQYESALGKVYELGNKHPELLPALKPLFVELDAANAEIKKQNEYFEKRLAEGAKKNANCDNLEAATEAFSALSTSMNLIGKPWQILRNFLIDKGPGKIIDAIPSKAGDGAKFAIEETFKVSTSILAAGAAGGPIAMMGVAIGLVGDVSQFFIKQRFKEFCEKFEGPVYTQFRSEFRHKTKPYYTYKFDMRGKIQLRYAKDKAIKDGTPIEMTGQIEGVIEKIETAENAILMEPQLASRVMLRKITAPPGVPYAEDVGTIARLALPQSFYIPIKGELFKGKLTLKIEEATKDISDLIKAQILYVFLEPSLPIPSIQTVVTPMQNAHFIFTRGMREKPEFEVKTAKDSITFEKVFTRTVEDPTADFKIEWKIDVKGCNPGCLPSVYFSKAK